MKVSFLYLLSDCDHLFNLVGIYLDALKRKEEEVDWLSHELEDTRNSLVCTQLALQDSERHVDELCLELSSGQELMHMAGTRLSFIVRSHVDDDMSMSSIHILDSEIVMGIVDKCVRSVGIFHITQVRSLLEFLVDLRSWIGCWDPYLST